MQLHVTLNGTDKNPYARWGLKHNPFPQIPKAELGAAMMQLNSLGGEPLQGEDDIRERLKGWDDEFIDACLYHFKPGEYVRFTVSFPYDENGNFMGQESKT
jgi:hypothetical protein